MTWFDFTATAATDMLTKVAHGLLTGDGPLTTLMRGGAEGGLSSATDYWAVRVDADNVKLATSQANALAGVPVTVDVTADTKGILGIGVPFKRLHTYVPKSADVAGSTVYSADLNKIQDAIIGGKFGPTPFVIPAAAFVKTSGAATLASGQWIGVGTFIAQLLFPVGTTIANIMWGYNRGGAGSISLTLAEANPVPAFAAGQFSISVSAGTGYARSDYTGADIDTTSAHKTLPANCGWAIEVDHTNAANVLGGLIITAFRD